MDFHESYHITDFIHALQRCSGARCAGTIYSGIGPGPIVKLGSSPRVRRGGKACSALCESRGLGSGLGERAPEVVAAFLISRSTNERQISLIEVLHTQPN